MKNIMCTDIHVWSVFLWQVAKTKQCIESEKMQVQVVERAQQIMLQEQEITRKEKELEAKVKKPAEAERYRLEKLAEAERWVMGSFSPPELQERQ